jgi:hypothetical protein
LAAKPYDLAIFFGHHVEARRGIVQERAHAGADHVAKELLLLGLERHGRVEVDQHRRVLRRGEPHLHQ